MSSMRPARLRVGLLLLSSFAFGCSAGDTATPVATVGLVPSKTRVAIGGPVDFTYRFEVASDATFDDDYTVFVHVDDTDGRRVWNDDHAPPTPTSQWGPGQTIEYTRTQFVPRPASAGDVTVQVGLYRGDARLPLLGPDEADRQLTERAYRVTRLQLLPESENIFLVYTGGWHPDEFDEGAPESTWKWTEQVATLSFANPRADALLYLEYDARPEVFADAPQTVTVTVGEQVLETFTADLPTARLRRIPIPAEALGNGDMAEIRLDVDRTFVPANLPAGGRDERELGIRVYHVFVERR